jgi:hypothetical protein
MASEDPTLPPPEPKGKNLQRQIENAEINVGDIVGKNKGKLSGEEKTARRAMGDLQGRLADQNPEGAPGNGGRKRRTRKTKRRSSKKTKKTRGRRRH